MSSSTKPLREDLTTLFTERKTKWNAKIYARRYEQYFESRRDEPLVLLEIGIGGYDDPKAGGQSLRVWERYFPNAKIYGVDITDKSFLDGGRIRTFKGSQVDAAFLEDVIRQIGAAPDIIIDDGSHRNDHVVTTFKLLFPRLRDDGIYVVEDTHFSHVPSFPEWSRVISSPEPPAWAQYGGSLDIHERSTMLGYFKRLSDCLNYQDFFRPGYEPNAFDRTVVGVHFFRNQVFVLKGDNTSTGNSWFKENSLRPEWVEYLKTVGVDANDLFGAFHGLPPIDDPTEL